MGMNDVVIVGAGPVGLLLAALLGRQGLSVLVVERNTERHPGSNAIGISPPSLQILASLGGLDQVLAARGAPIRKVVFHGEQASVLGALDFSVLKGAHPYILSVPQPETVRVLEDLVATLPSVKIEYGLTFEELEQGDDSVTALFRDAQGNPRAERSGFLVGCDGVKSTVREAVDLGHSPRRAEATFFMGDYPDTTPWGHEGHLFFTREGAVESFPLGGGRRRWIVQTPSWVERSDGLLERAVRDRTGWRLDEQACQWSSPFGIHRWISPHYAWGRVYLAGDSAHQMAPIIGQGMNTGFADAQLLAALLGARVRQPQQGSETWNGQYSRIRRHAAQAAADRAAFALTMGTVRGPLSVARNLVLRLGLSLINPLLSRHAAMVTIPGRDVSDAKRLHPRALADLKVPS